MPNDPYADAIDAYYKNKATLSAGSVADVNPVSATTALQVAPKAGIAPASVMQDPTPVVQQVKQQENHTILQNSPSLQSAVGSDATFAAAIGDSYKHLAALGQWAQDHVGMAKATGSGLFESVASFAGQTALRGLDQSFSMAQSALKLGNIISGNGTENDLRPPDMTGQFVGRMLTRLSGADYTPQNEAERIMQMVGGAIPYAFTGGPEVPLLSRLSAVVLPTAGAYGAQKGVAALGGGEDLQSIAGAVGGMLGLLPHALGSVRVPPAVVEAYVKARYGKTTVTGVEDVPQGPYTDQLRLPGPDSLTRDTSNDSNPPPPPPGFPGDLTAAAHVDSIAGARDIIASSPIGQRAPEVVADFLENHTRIGDEQVWIPAGTLLDNHAAGQTTFGYTTEQLWPMYQNGEHVAVPYSQYLAETAGKPEANELDKQIRFTQGGQSQKEYKAQQDAEAKLAETAAAKAPTIPSLTEYTKVGEKFAGSNPGAIYVDKAKTEYLVKGSNHTTLKTERAVNEAQANALYSMASTQPNLVSLIDLGEEHGGGLGIASKLLTGAKPFNPNDQFHSQSLRADFALHAWLANRDVTGLTFDNLLYHAGYIKPIDMGGALRFRGMGEIKTNFNENPIELVGFKDPAINKQAAQVFGSMSYEEEKDSAARIQHIDPISIRNAITLNGAVPFDKELFNILIARQTNILAEYGLDYPFTEKDVFAAEEGEQGISLYEELFGKEDWEYDKPAQTVAITPNLVQEDGSVLHNKLDDSGNAVKINEPSTPTAADTWYDSFVSAVFVPGSKTPKELNGVPVSVWSPPANWKGIEGTVKNLDEVHPFVPTAGKKTASGVLIVEPDGRLWLVKPTNEFGGYVNTFPKGTLDTELNLQQNAIKEAYEETGLKVNIVDLLGDYDRTTSRTRFYIAMREAGTPADMGWESQAVRLAPMADAAKLLNNDVDKRILKDLQAYADTYADIITPIIDKPVEPNYFPEPKELGIDLDPDQQESWNRAKSQVKIAIVKAANELFLGNLFEDNKALGMNKTTFKNFSKQVQKEFMQKAAKLWKKTLNNVRNEKNKEWRAAYAVNQLAVENQVLAEPGIKASHLLRYSTKTEDPLRKDNAFVDKEGNPVTFYHASWHDDIGITSEELALKKAEFERKNPHITVEFDPNPWRPMNHDVISFTTDPEFANDWRKDDYDINDPVRRRVLYTTHLHAKVPGDFRIEADVEKAAQWYVKHHLYDYADIKKQLARGAWEKWENPVMWKACGFDAAYMLEKSNQSRDKPNACVADPAQIYFKYMIRPGVESPSFKLSPDIKKLYPKTLWENLPNIMFSAEEGMDADTVAAALDMNSGEELLNSLTQVEAARGKVPFRKFVGDMIKQGTMAATKVQVGDVASPEAILAEAKALFAEPDITTLLEARLKTVADVMKAQGLDPKFSKDDVKARAVTLWEKLPVELAVDTRAMEKQITAMGRTGQVALAAGKFTEAFDSWQKQLIAKYQLTETYKLQKQVRSITKTLSRWAKADAIPGVDPAVGAILQKAIEGLGYTLRRDAAELERFLANPDVNKGFTDVSTLIHVMNLMGSPTVEAVLPAKFANSNDEVLPKLTVDQFRQYTNMLKAIATFGRDENKITVAGKQVALQTAVNTSLRNMAELGAKYTADQLHSRAIEHFGKFKHIVKSVLTANLRPEVFLHWADGGKHGILMQSAVDPLEDSAYHEADMIDSWVKAMKAVNEEHNIIDTHFQAVSTPDFMDYVTPKGERVKVVSARENIRRALAYLGTESGRLRLREGFGWDDAQEQWILSQVNEADKAFVVAYWAENEKLFPLADKMYMRIRGYGVEKQEPREIVFPDGAKLAGGFTHIDYDKSLKLSSKAGKNQVATDPLVIDPLHPVTALTPSGYTKPRTNTAGPVNLTVESMSRGIAETIHDIAFRESLINAQKILTNPDVAEALQKTLGPEYQDQIMPWLRYIAGTNFGEDPTLSAATVALRRMTSNIVFTKLALNANAALKHTGIGFMHMLNEVKDPVLLSKCLAEVVMPGAEGDALRAFISEKSGAVRTALYTANRSIGEGIAADAFTGGRLADWQKTGYILFTTARLVESRATWLARYRQEVNEHGDSYLAVRIANKAVRDTQGAGSVVDTPALLRQSQGFYGALADGVFQTLMGFRNTAPNRYFTMMRLIDRGVKTMMASPGDAATALAGVGGGDGGDVIDGDFTVLDDGGTGRPSASEDLGKAASIFTTYALSAAFIVTVFGVWVRGEHAKGKKATDELGLKYLMNLGEQLFGSLGGVATAYATIEAAFEHYGAQGMVQGLLTDAVHVFDKPTDRQLIEAVKIFSAPFGIVPDSMANAAQVGVYAAQDKLSEEDKSIPGILQTVGLGRKTDAEHADKKHTSHRR